MGEKTSTRIVTVGGAVAALTIWALRSWQPEIEVPAGIEAAVAVLATSVISYLTKEDMLG
jgi:hypothetical protein